VFSDSCTVNPMTGLCKNHYMAWLFSAVIKTLPIMYILTNTEYYNTDWHVNETLLV